MMKFMKMHGAGNDYVYVNCLEETIENPDVLARQISDRHFGVGSDGLVLILPSGDADVRMRMFNPDGSEAQMCGNAIRCVGKLCYERGICSRDVIAVETLAGIRQLALTVAEGKVSAVRVNMGEPVLEPALIPTRFDGNRAVERPLVADGKRWVVTCVSMGNPHAVIFTQGVDDLDLGKIGPSLEAHELFPERANIGFVEALDSESLRMRVWERGTGETLACGTGACAALVAAALTGRTGRAARVMLRGGELGVSWNEADDCVYLSGPAEFVFDGELYGGY